MQHTVSFWAILNSYKAGETRSTQYYWANFPSCLTQSEWHIYWKSWTTGFGGRICTYQETVHGKTLKIAMGLSSQNLSNCSSQFHMPLGCWSSGSLLKGKTLQFFVVAAEFNFLPSFIFISYPPSFWELMVVYVIFYFNFTTPLKMGLTGKCMYVPIF